MDDNDMEAIDKKINEVANDNLDALEDSLKHMDMKLLKKPRKPSKLFQLQTYVNKKQDNWKQYLFMEG